MRPTLRAKPPTVVAIRNGRVAWRTDVGASPHGLVVDESRHVLLAAATGSSRVAVVHPPSGRLLQGLAVPAGPAGMSYDPATGTGFAAAQWAGVLVSIAPS